MTAKNLGLTCAEYQQQRSKRPYKLTHSLAADLVITSPAHALVNLLSGNESNKRQDIGTILHELLLGKGKGFAVSDGFTTKKGEVSLNWQSTEAKAFKELAIASGRVPMFSHELAEYQRIADILRAKIERIVPEQLGGIEWAKGETETAWEWSEDDVICEKHGLENGIICRAMLDWRFEATVLDLKIWDSADPSARKLYEMGSDIQQAAYTNLAEAIDPAYEDRGRFALLVCEPNPPYAVRLVTLGPQLAAIGMKRWNDAKAQFKVCQETDKWPEYPPLLEVEADVWMLRKWEVSVYPEAEAFGEETYNADEWNAENEW